MVDDGREESRQHAHVEALRTGRLGFLGFGVEAASALRLARRWGNEREATIFADEAPREPLPGVRVVLGAAEPGAFDGLDALVRSPGMKPSHPTIAAALAGRAPITTASRVYLELTRGAGLTVVGVTGSKGKSTTSTLIYRALREAGLDAVLVGNIGNPALDELDGVLGRRAITVIELSSYQCNDLHISPGVGVLTALFPEHLDWHGTLEAYYGAKANVARHQAPSDALVYDGTSAAIAQRLPLGAGAALPYGDERGFAFREGAFYRRDERLFDDGGFLLRGQHNRKNACAALTVAERLGIAAEVAFGGMRGFAGLPHRCEVVGTFGGLTWVNDSISTAPEAAQAALDAFGSDVGALIVGGFDRGYDFTGLAADVARRRVPLVAVIAPSGLRMAEALAALGPEQRPQVHEATDLPDAVAWVAARAAPGSTCLFSPGSPSYGRYRDFQERGEHLRALCRALGG